MKQLKSAKILTSANAICHVAAMLEKNCHFGFILRNQLNQIYIIHWTWLYFGFILRDCAVITVHYILFKITVCKSHQGFYSVYMALYGLHNTWARLQAHHSLFGWDYHAQVTVIFLAIIKHLLLQQCKFTQCPWRGFACKLSPFKYKPADKKGVCCR